MRAAARCDAGGPPVLIEIGSYCGRATVPLALAVRGLGRTDVRVVAVDEPGLGLLPNGRVPRAVLRELGLTAQAGAGRETGAA